MKKNTVLRSIREKSGKTQAEIAKELGMLREMYQKYEYGAGTKTIQTAIKIAKALGSTVEELWGSERQNNF